VRALRVTIIGCEALKKVKPAAYLGYKLLEDGRIEHLLLKGRRRAVRVRVRCDECVLSRILKASALLSMPVVVDGYLVRFLVLETREVAKLLEESRGRVVSVERVEVEDLVLTDRQRYVLKLAADGGGASPSRIAWKLGVTRQAAQKLIKTALRKVSMLLT
jgi:DNA-binding CsgD family transcriptional regulator